MNGPEEFPAILAAFDLGERAGAKSMHFWWMCPHTPTEDDAHQCEGVTWHMTAMYQGYRIAAEDADPEAAAIKFAVTLLDGGRCKCGRTVAMGRALVEWHEGDDRLNVEPGQCVWRLEGERWESGCEAPTLTVHGARGDLGAMMDSFARSAAAMAAAADRLALPDNRAARRAAKRANRKRGK